MEKLHSCIEIIDTSQKRIGYHIALGRLHWLHHCSFPKACLPFLGSGPKRAEILWNTALWLDLSLEAGV